MSGGCGAQSDYPGVHRLHLNLCWDERYEKEDSAGSHGLVLVWAHVASSRTICTHRLSGSETEGGASGDRNQMQLVGLAERECPL